jgi:hypothetical protein
MAEPRCNWRKSGIGRALRRSCRGGISLSVCVGGCGLRRSLGGASGASFVRQLDVVRLRGDGSVRSSLTDGRCGSDILCSRYRAINSPLRCRGKTRPIGVNVRGLAPWRMWRCIIFVSRARVTWSHFLGWACEPWLFRHIVRRRRRSHYLRVFGITLRIGLSIAVTDVQPGFVDTAMVRGRLFWVLPRNRRRSRFSSHSKKTAQFIPPRRGG